MTPLSTLWERAFQLVFPKLSFATPWLLWSAFVIPLYIGLLFAWDMIRRGQLTRRLGELPVLGKVLASASPGRRIAKAVIVTFACAFIAFALARPRIEGQRKVELHGLDLVVAVDVSKSMLVEDIQPTQKMADKKLDPNRLERARELAGAVIEELPNDRVGPVVFAGAAAHFPLTEDQQAATRFFSDLGPNDLPPGSNLAEVFRVGRCMLRPDLYEDLGCARIGRRGHGGDPLRSGESLDPPDLEKAEKVEEKGERGKAILVLTDGGDADAETVREVRACHELGIAVFLVGVGTEKGGVVYEVDPFTGKKTATPKRTPEGNEVVSKRDDAGMRGVAEAGGDENRYLPAAPGGEVDKDVMKVVGALHAINRGLATKQVKEMHELYQPYLFLGIMLLLVEAAIGTRRRRRYPEAR